MLVNIIKTGMICRYWKDQGHTNLPKRNTGGKQQPSVQHEYMIAKTFISNC